jgi:transcriptional regulator with XRE-family HTH domain
MGTVIQISAMVKKIDNPPNRLREIRNARTPRVTLRNIAEALGTTQAVIARLETGERPLYLHTAQRIAGFLNISVADLLNPEDNPYSLDDRERAVIDAMRHGQSHVADAVHRVAESLTAFSPEAPTAPDNDATPTEAPRRRA